MKKAPLIIIIILMTSVLYAWHGEYCTDDGVCMIMDQENSEVKVRFQNKLPMENQISTVTFEVKPGLENLRCRDRFPLTKIVTGPDVTDITTFTMIDPSKKWNSNLKFYWQYGSPANGKKDTASCRLPFAPGKRYRVMQGFNGKVSHYAETKYAVDFRMPIGEPIHAARDGVVLATEDRQGEGKFELSYITKSNYVLIQHDDGTTGRYYHLVKGGVKTAAGQSVKAGDLIGFSGNSGYSGSPHLHFEISRPVDGKSKTTIPFTFITDYGDNETPIEGVVYSDNNLPVKSRTPFFSDSIALCREVKDLQPVDITDTISKTGKAELFIPIDIPGVYSIKLLIYNEQNKANAKTASWKTGKTWWYTTYTIDGKYLSGDTGKWKIEISADSKPVRTLDFKME